MERDGIYKPRATEILKSYSEAEAGKLRADRNVFDWYEANVPALDGCHVVDWGAGVGRFVPFYHVRGAARIFLIEPSASAHEALGRAFGGERDIEIMKAELGATIPRAVDREKTVHFCTFVINCCATLRDGFERLERSVLPGERLYLFTNAFAPTPVVDRIASARVEDAITGTVESLCREFGRPPRSKTFTNQIVESGQTLTDSVHTVQELGLAMQSGWAVDALALLLPDGFQHVIQPGEDFGDYKFTVVAAALERRA